MSKSVINTALTTTLSTLAVATVLFMGFLTIPQAKAATAEELQAMIAKLMAQIAYLQTQIPTTPSEGTSNVLAVGTQITTTDTLRVRSTPSKTGGFVSTQPLGAKGKIVEGPVMADGIAWFKVDYETGVDGWNAGGWLRKRTDVADVQKVDLMSIVRVYDGKVAQLMPGANDVVVATAAIPSASFDRYANKAVLVFRSSQQTSKPWEVFTHVGLRVNGVKVGLREVNDASAWTAVDGGYALTVYSGNNRLAANKYYELAVSVSVANNAKVGGEPWKIVIPKEGAVVWSAVNGHMRNANVVPLTEVRVGKRVGETASSTNEKPKVTIVSITNSQNPVVTGLSEERVTSLGFSITNGDKIYGSGDITPKEGHWTHTVATALVNGKYTLIVSVQNKEVARKVFTVGATTVTEKPVTRTASSTAGTLKVKGEVKGASTDVYSEISATLGTISALLKDLK